MLNFCTALFNFNKKWVICVYILVLILYMFSTTQALDPNSISDDQFRSHRLKPEVRITRATSNVGTNLQNQKLYLKNPQQSTAVSKRALIGELINNDEDKRIIKGYQKYKRRRSPLAIVYVDRKPIGILEPISREYEYQNLQDNSNLNSLYKRNNYDLHTEGDESNVQKGYDVKLNENPSFKDDNYLEEENSIKSQQKRNIERVHAFKTSPNKDLNNGDTKLTAIENNLKEIINDLNRINEDDDDIDEIDKRDIQSEDEDLDYGDNKIDISKEAPVKRHTDIPKSSDLEDKIVDTRSNVINSKKIADYRNEGEKFIRQKRQQVSPSTNRNEGNDIVKGLEASGDLTVSGNKSPLASASAPVETENKKINGGDYEKRDKQASDDSDYEKRLQRNIQNKISEIKEQVKREIRELKANNNAATEPSTSNENNDMKRNVEHEIKMLIKNKGAGNLAPRHKRNLLDRETNEDFDLVKNTEVEGLMPHIRQRRDLTKDSIKDTEELESHRRSRPSLVQIQIGKGLNKRANKENNKNTKDTKRDNDHSETSLGFQNNQNQDVVVKVVTEQPDTGAHAKRGIKRSPVLVSNTLDAEKLERLVRESASLTESIKSERGARYSDITPHIEVELHSSMAKGQIKGRTTETQKREDEESETLAEDEDKGNTANFDAKRKARSAAKSNSKKFQKESDENKASIAEISEVAAVSDGSSASNRENNEHSYKAFEASHRGVTKMTDIPSVSSEAKSIEIRTNRPDAGYMADDSNSADFEETKVGKVKKDKKVAKINDDSEDNNNNSDNEDLNKRSPNNSNEADDNVKPVTEDNKVRQERKSEPELSLEDMQELDSENKMRRRRRIEDDYYDTPREKRSQYPLPNYLRYHKYRGDEDEADDESDEFDDDNFDDRTANIVRKRGTDDQENYDDLDEDYEPLNTNQEDVANRVNKRNTNARSIVEQMNEDVYDDTSYLYDSNGQPLNRNKRQVFDGKHENLAALHGGGPMVRHLVAIKDRNARIDDSRRLKRLEKTSKGNENSNKNQIIASLTENDIFGALPQSYEGELTRFKRVKRDDPSVDHAVANG